jgi:hypothetical protein
VQHTSSNVRSRVWEGSVNVVVAGGPYGGWRQILDVGSRVWVKGEVERLGGDQ